ncbi:MAG: M23 family metallopeptidase [Deltaproteobacteria bacterium]|nr:M23 family metallopeptidase [Deltaproteobacteria bacterium]
MWSIRSLRRIASIAAVFAIGFLFSFSDRTLAEPLSKEPSIIKGVGEEVLAAASVERVRTRKRYDYSRFSNGLRWVPRPRGAALRRATALGLGTYESAKRLLRTPPDKKVLDACRGEEPKTLLWPVVGGKWGRGFGYTRKYRKQLRHNGVDIGAPQGNPVRAAADGIVAYSDNGLRGLGNVVLVIHRNGWSTLYAHNLRNTVQAGWLVKRGERIALVGSTGIARGPHLHFEFRSNGRLADPARFFVGYRSKEINGPIVEL